MNGPLLQESESPWGFFLQLRGDSGQEKRSWEALKELSVPQECLKPVAPLYTSISAHTHPETCEGGLDGWGGLQDLPASLRCFYTLRRCGQVQVGGGNVLCAFCVYNCLFYVCVFEQGGRGDPGLPGLPGPAGYRGQKGDRVRDTQRHMMSADVWRSTVVISWCHLV